MNFIFKKKISYFFLLTIIYSFNESTLNNKNKFKKNTKNTKIIKIVPKKNLSNKNQYEQEVMEEEEIKVDMEENNNSEPYLNKATIAEISQKNTHGQQISKDQFILALKHEIQKLKQKINSLQKLLNKEGGGFKKLKEDYEKSLKDIAYANQVNLQLQTKNKQEIIRKDEEIKKLKNEIYKHTEQINNFKKNSIVLENKIKKIEKDNIEKTNKITSLTSNINEIKELITILKNKKEILELLLLHYRTYIKELMAVK